MSSYTVYQQDISLGSGKLVWGLLTNTTGAGTFTIVTGLSAIQNFDVWGTTGVSASNFNITLPVTSGSVVVTTTGAVINQWMAIGIA